MIRSGRLEVETPDNVVLRYDLAGGGNRGFAAVVDFAVAALLVAGMGSVGVIVVSFFPRSTVLAGVLIAATLFVGWAYFVALEWLGDGQTLGKRIFGLRVISADGSPAPFSAILIRNLLRVVDFLPAFYGIGLLAIVATSRSQRLGDLAAGTFVVRAPRPRLDLAELRTVARDVPSAASPAPIEVGGMSGELQRLVREFVAREAGLSEADRQRVASSLAAAIRARAPDAPARDDVALIHEVARSLRASGERA